MFPVVVGHCSGMNLFANATSLSSIVLNQPSGHHLHFALTYFNLYENDCPGFIWLISSIPFTSVMRVLIT